MRRPLAFVALLRPVNVVLFFAGVALGGVLAAGPDAFAEGARVRLALAMLSAACVGGAANAINDYYDLAIDRVNRPGRPLPSGAVTPRAAVGLWAGLSTVGIAVGAFVSAAHAALALLTVGLLWAYSARLKRTPGPGHLVVAGVLALALYYGGLAAAPHAPGAALLGAAFAALTTLAREAAKAIEDAEGDAADGARTLPLVWGARRTAGAALAVVALTVAVLPLPALALGRGWLALALPAAGCLLAAAWTLLAADGQHEESRRKTGDAALRTGARRASAWLKGAMAAGVLALAAARLGG